MVKNCAEAKVFLAVSLICGLLLVFLIPPLNAADEAVHFANVYAISRGDFFPNNFENSYTGHYLPQTVYNYSVKYPGALHGNREEKYSYAEMINESLMPTVLGEKVSRTGGQVPTGYLAAACGMAIGNVIGNEMFDPTVNAQPYNQMLYGRLGNLFFYILITYLAICIIPRYKRILLLIAVMPMSLFLSASLSYDPPVIAVSFFFIAIALYMMKTGDKTITKSEIAAVLFSTFFLVGAKQAYAPLLLLLLGIPKTKYGSIKKMILCIVSVILIAVIAYIPVWICSARESGIVTSDMVTKQEQWVSSHIGETIKAIIHTLRVKQVFYTESFWGRLGWLDTPFPIPIMILGYVALFFVSVADVFEWNPAEYGKNWKRLLPLGSVLLSFIGMELIMYLHHTPRPEVLNEIGSSYVEGVQGRYFIPLFVPFLLPFSNGLLVRFKKNKTEKTQACLSGLHRLMSSFAMGWAVMCGTYTVLIVLLRYWI